MGLGYTDTGKQRKTCSRVRFMNCKCHINRPGIKGETARWKVGDQPPEACHGPRQFLTVLTPAIKHAMTGDDRIWFRQTKELCTATEMCDGSNFGLPSTSRLTALFYKLEVGSVTISSTRARRTEKRRTDFLRQKQLAVENRNVDKRHDLIIKSNLLYHL
jgi:hypothetical protein